MSYWIDIGKDEQKIILAYEGNKLIGWGLAFSPGLIEDKNATCGVYILPKHRGKGYGCRIGAKVFSLAKEQGFERLELSYHSPHAKELYSKIAKTMCKNVPYKPMLYPLKWKLVKL